MISGRGMGEVWCGCLEVLRLRPRAAFAQDDRFWGVSFCADRCGRSCDCGRERPSRRMTGERVHRFAQDDRFGRRQDEVARLRQLRDRGKQGLRVRIGWVVQYLGGGPGLDQVAVA